MKKILLILFLCFLTINSVRAEDECWGTESKTLDGVTYCWLFQRMNWYSAFAWCDAQGKHLVSLNELCDSGNTVHGLNTTICQHIYAMQPNMNTTAIPAWTTSVDNEGNAYAQGSYNTAAKAFSRKGAYGMPVCM